MKDFYVYAHKVKSPRAAGEIFYIGKGRGKRAWSRKGRNVWWKRIVAKYGYSVEMLASDLSEHQAFDLEKAFISICGRTSLCNLTDGGEGSSGCVPSEATRAKISAANKGRVPTADHRKKISAAKLGHSVSKAARLKIGAAASARGHKPGSHAKQSKSVSCSNGMQFESVGAAVRWLKANGFPKASKGNVALRCSGKFETAYGFKWNYAE